MNVLGYDPGKTSGACGLLVEGVATGWWTWTPVAGGYRVRSDDRGERLERTYENLHDVGRTVIGDARTRARVAAELPLPKRRNTPAKDTVTLSIACGLLLGPLLDLGPLEWVEPRHWRRSVLHLRGTEDARAAEEAAVAWARRSLRWACGKPDGLTYAEEGAVCESFAIATHVHSGAHAGAAP